MLGVYKVLNKRKYSPTPIYLSIPPGLYECCVLVTIGVQCKKDIKLKWQLLLSDMDEPPELVKAHLNCSATKQVIRSI